MIKKKFCLLVIFLFILNFSIVTSHADPCNCGILEIQVRIAGNAPWPPDGVWVWTQGQDHRKVRIDSTGWVQLRGLPTAKCDQSGDNTFTLTIQGWMQEIWDIHIPDCGVRYFSAVLSKCSGGWFHHGSGTGQNIPPNNCWQ